MRGSAPRRYQKGMVALPIISVLLTLTSATPLAAAGRTCFSADQTRAQIAAHKLVEPFKLMKEAASVVKGDPLGGKLCRWNEDFVYEISLLRRDGHVVHVFMNAANGQRMQARADR